MAHNIVSEWKPVEAYSCLFES